MTTLHGGEVCGHDITPGDWYDSTLYTSGVANGHGREYTRTERGWLTIIRKLTVSNNMLATGLIMPVGSPLMSLCAIHFRYILISSILWQLMVARILMHPSLCMSFLISRVARPLPW